MTDLETGLFAWILYIHTLGKVPIYFLNLSLYSSTHGLNEYLIHAFINTTKGVLIMFILLSKFHSDAPWSEERYSDFDKAMAEATYLLESGYIVQLIQE